MSTKNLTKIAISEKCCRKQQVMGSGWEGRLEELLISVYGNDSSFSRTMVEKQAVHWENSHMHSHCMFNAKRTQEV